MSNSVGRPVRTYFWNDAPNFGDQLSSEILRFYGLNPTWAAPHQAECVVVGSVLELLPPHFSGLIAGAGFIRPGASAQFPHATVLGARGPETLARLANPNRVTLGDPGLLMATLYPRRATTHALGIVPHYIDREHPWLRRVAARWQPEVQVIDVRQTPAEVAAEISACSAILSSSLHGLITADSYGIPAAPIVLSEGLVGGRYKFQDYDAALGLNRAPLDLTEDRTLTALLRQIPPTPERVAEVVASLQGMFARFPQALRRCRWRAYRSYPRRVLQRLRQRFQRRDTGPRS